MTLWMVFSPASDEKHCLKRCFSQFSCIGISVSNSVWLSCPLCSAGLNSLLSPKTYHLVGGTTSSLSNMIDVKLESFSFRRSGMGPGLHF